MSIHVACNYCPKHVDRPSDSFPAQCVLSNGAPCRACARQLELRGQIEETKKLLDRLIVEEHQARIEINQSHDPIQQLPPEIISHIFSYTLPAFTFLVEAVESYWLESKSRQRAWSETGVLSLGAVCQLWRNVAWSTSQLWSDVMLSLTDEPTDNMVEVVKEWLARSRNLPLSIRLYLSDQIVWDEYEPDDDPVASDQIQWFINLFNEHSSRWQKLYVRCERELLECFHGDESATSHLKALQLLVHSNGSESWPVFDLGGVTPQLDHINTMGFPRLEFIGVSWNNVTHATVEGLALPDCVQLLHVAPKLMDLHLRNVGRIHGWNNINAIPQTPLIHPHLRSLSISGAVPFEAVIDSIILPSLKRLSIHGPEIRHISTFHLPSSNIIDLIERSSCSLVFLSLRYCTCEDEEIINIINSLPPTLKILILGTLTPTHEDHSLHVLSSYLSRIPSATSAMPPQSTRILLPKLEKLEFFVFRQTQIPWDLLLNILRLGPMSGKRRRHFKKLVITPREPPSSKKAARAPLITKSQNIDKSVIRGLLGMQDNGIKFYLPRLVPRRNLLELLEDN